MSYLSYPDLKFHNCQIKELPLNKSQLVLLEDLRQKRFSIQVANDLVINCQYFGLSQSESITIMKFYRDNKGLLSTFEINEDIFSDIDPAIRRSLSILNISGLWRFNTPVQLKTTVTEVYDINFDLLGVAE